MQRRERSAFGIPIALAAFGFLAWLSLQPAIAGDEHYGWLPTDSDQGWLRGTFDGEFGARYWLSSAKSGKTLYGLPGDPPVSRLTYAGMVGQSAELFGDINRQGYFVKGFAGLGALMRGSLTDEDFEPFIDPYSSTISNQSDGHIGYLTVDAGGYFANTRNARMGVFFGYNYFRQDMSAFGCTQTATNPDICVPSIPNSTKGITQENNWNSLRLGVNGEARFGKGWRLRGEAAVLPLVGLWGTDYHWLRICSDDGCFTGGVPSDGLGWGYQLEAMLDYTVADKFTFGVGGRYWHMQSNGNAHFENHVVGENTVSQRVDWSTDILGVTAHATLHY